MVRLIRYVIYFLIIMLCLFWLQKHNVNVKAGFSSMWSNLTSFGNDIKDAPAGDPNAIYDEISKQNFVGGLGATTTSSTSRNYVKSYDSGLKKNSTDLAELTVDGLIKYTNAERVKAGLKPLIPERRLSASALKKANDMLDRQYFEHVSPDGRTAVNLVRDQGYAYQVVGENLALGDFGSDKKVVEAWMNSPTHKANILNAKFTELGIGIVKGNYNGSTVWLAVQHFGKPIPSCPVVSQDTKKSIDAEKFKLEGEEKQLHLLAEEIEADPEQNKGKEFLEAYNARVTAYNTGLDALKKKIDKYNADVGAYNACLGAAPTV